MMMMFSQKTKKNRCIREKMLHFLWKKFKMTLKKWLKIWSSMRKICAERSAKIYLSRKKKKKRKRVTHMSKKSVQQQIIDAMLSVELHHVTQRLQHVSQNSEIHTNSAYVNLKSLLKVKSYSFISDSSSDTLLLTLKEFDRAHI